MVVASMTYPVIDVDEPEHMETPAIWEPSLEVMDIGVSGVNKVPGAEENPPSPPTAKVSEFSKEESHSSLSSSNEELYSPDLAHASSCNISTTQDSLYRKPGKYLYYPPLYEETGADENPSLFSTSKVSEFMEEENNSSLPSSNEEPYSLDSAHASSCNINTTQDSLEQNPGKYFYYGPPLYEETGIWIPVSIPPMSQSDHDEWRRGFMSNGGYFPKEEFSWDQLAGEYKEMTMWDVVSEMLLMARSKVGGLSLGELRIFRTSWMPMNLLEETWKEMASTIVEANLERNKGILETDPPKWLPDSAAAACMLCNARFHPLMCSRHHCRFCGGIFCNDCSKGRILLPPKFRVADPQRVCDVCFVRLESVQPYLMEQISRASQLPTHDLTDLSTLRSWLNFPWGRTMEYEIYKAANIIHGYNKVGLLKPERSIPDVILKQAKGLAIITVVNIGLMVTYKVGTGLVIARREDGSWSPPSAISSFGVGWGAQAGGELTDFIIVLRNKDAVKTFSGNAHLSIGAGVSAAAGILGRAAEADIRAGDGGYAACYTYSCSKGAFVGFALNGNLVMTRTFENSRFYGASIDASDILLGSMLKPPAAAILYRALSDVYQKLES